MQRPFHGDLAHFHWNGDEADALVGRGSTPAALTGLEEHGGHHLGDATRRPILVVDNAEIAPAAPGVAYVGSRGQLLNLGLVSDEVLRATLEDTDGMAPAQAAPRQAWSRPRRPADPACSLAARRF